MRIVIVLLVILFFILALLTYNINFNDKRRQETSKQINSQPLPVVQKEEPYRYMIIMYIPSGDQRKVVVKSFPHLKDNGIWWRDDKGCLHYYSGTFALETLD